MPSASEQDFRRLGIDENLILLELREKIRQVAALTEVSTFGWGKPEIADNAGLITQLRQKIRENVGRFAAYDDWQDLYDTAQAGGFFSLQSLKQLGLEPPDRMETKSFLDFRVIFRIYEQDLRQVTNESHASALADIDRGIVPNAVSALDYLAYYSPVFIAEILLNHTAFSPDFKVPAKSPDQAALSVIEPAKFNAADLGLTKSELEILCRAAVIVAARPGRASAFTGLVHVFEDLMPGKIN